MTNNFCCLHLELENPSCTVRMKVHLVTENVGYLCNLCIEPGFHAGYPRVSQSVPGCPRELQIPGFHLVA